jgi:hypothetical protein
MHLEVLRSTEYVRESVFEVHIHIYAKYQHAYTHAYTPASDGQTQLLSLVEAQARRVLLLLHGHGGVLSFIGHSHSGHGVGGAVGHGKYTCSRYRI